MLQEKLKEATKENHDILEQLMFVQQIMNGTLTLPQYKQILYTNYIVHQQLEDHLANGLSAELAAAIDTPNRHKLAALKADMEELNMPIPEATETAISFYNEPEILGALYVLEGATLGGNVIVKRLKVNPALNNLNLGFHYYQVYGENLIPYWKQFVEVLNNQPEDNDDAAIAGAKKMFGHIAATQQQSLV